MKQKKMLSYFLLIFLILSTIVIIEKSTNANQESNLFFTINGYGGNGYDQDLIDWIRLPGLIENSLLEPAISDSSSEYRIAIFESGLDYATWTFLESTYTGVNFRCFVPEYNPNTEATYQEISRLHGSDITTLDKDGNDIRHGTAICSLLASLLEGTNTEVFVFHTHDSYGNPDRDRIKSAFSHIEYLWWFEDIKIKVISMSMSIADDTEIEQSINTLSADPYHITILASSGNEADDDVNADVAYYPSVYANVLGVGGITFKGDYIGNRMMLRDRTGHLFCAYASCYYGNPSPRLSNPIIMAPGASVEVMFDIGDDGIFDYYEATGTSLSSPIAAVLVLFIYRIHFYHNSALPISVDEVYNILSTHSEGWYLDITKQPEPGNLMIHFEHVGWGGIDFYDVCYFAWNYFKPVGGGGGGGGGGPSPR